MLLAILLGPAAGIVTMAAILIVQCLLFQDGGLLALGCNIINMGVIPCLLGGGLYRAVLGPAANAAAWRQYLAAWMACVAGVTAGAAMVPVEAAASGVLQVPLRQFLGVMIGVHLLIGLCRRRHHLRGDRLPAASPARVDGAGTGRRVRRVARPGYGVVAASLVVTALLLAGVVSWFASTLPDGLEWSCVGHRYPVRAAAEKAVRNDSPVVAAVERWQEQMVAAAGLQAARSALASCPLVAKGESARLAWPDGWRSLAGILGTIVTPEYPLRRVALDAQRTDEDEGGRVKDDTRRDEGSRDAGAMGIVLSHSSPVSTSFGLPFDPSRPAMHHHFIDRFAMGDSPVHRLDARAKLVGGAGLHRRADQLRPLRRGRAGAAWRCCRWRCSGSPRVPVWFALRRRGDPQPVHPHARA